MSKLGSQLTAMSNTASDQKKPQLSTKPHIAFMQKRTRHKPRTANPGEQSHWGPIIPEPDDLSAM
jgi:hypothetical protein